MKKLNISGMNCMHCVATVKEAIENVSGVSSVNVSLENKEAEFEADDSVDIEDIKKAVSQAGDFSAN